MTIPRSVAPEPDGLVNGESVYNLPSQPTPLVGRNEDILAARHALQQQGVRLLTLTGPAGVGKTRLALGIADCVLDLFPDGVCFVELAPTPDPSLVTATIAEALGVREVRDQPLLPRLKSFFADQSMLLLLDNFEHVQSAADQVAQLLSACPSIKILTTSRVALRLRWEHVRLVKPLPVPRMVRDEDALAEANESLAVQLFVERAQAASPTFEVTAENAAIINQLCARLDGLPLAIELAAARISLLSPKQMLARLDQRFELLVDGAADLPLRQRTLRNAMDYGFDLLTLDEQTLFAHLGVFAAGFTAEAATAVAQGAGTPGAAEFETLNRLDSLLQKSLLYQDTSVQGQVRFRMLETLRSYALDRLAASGSHDTARERWVEYHRALTTRASAALLGRGQGEWLTVLDREMDNLRDVLQWCIDTEDAESGLELVGNLWRYWLVRGLLTEGRRWIDDVLDLPLAEARSPMRARALSAGGELAYQQGDHANAERLLRDSLAVYRELEDRRGIATALDNLGRLISRHGDPASALSFLEESLSVKRELDDRWGIAQVLHDLADLAIEQQQLATARSRHEECLLHWQALGDVLSVASVFECMAILAHSQGHTPRALKLAGASSALREQLESATCAPVQRQRLQEMLDSAQTTVGAQAAANYVEEGRALSLDEAVQYARTAEQSQAAATAKPRSGQPSVPEHVQLLGLSAREREVAALLLRGMSNRQIAQELVITERTAETHVCRILSKLGLGSRAQLAALLVEPRLPQPTGPRRF
jgi:predicted ATPase/DNA-binding NarL/FixJ family response regulator